MFKKVICITVCLVLSCVSALRADTVYLKNGSSIAGIITREDDDSVEIKINIGAVVKFSKQDIERIERDTDTKHTKMRDAWKAEKTKKKLSEAKKDTFGKEEKAKGLVDYKGKWVTPAEKERLQAVNIARGFDKGRGEKRFLSRNDNKKRSDLSKKLLAMGDWFVRDTEHFSIFYRDASQAKIVSDKAEYYFEKIVYDLAYEDDIPWNKKCHVYIVENIDKWKDFLKEVGLNAGLVGGFVPNYGEKEMFLCALSDGYLAVTFPHELTHLIFKDIAGRSTIPLWLNEGLANYEASITSVSNKLLVKYIKQSRHLLLGDLLRMTDYPAGKEMRELFYAQSEKLVEFLITQYGREKFRDFCGLILKDRSFWESLADVYKGDFEDIEGFNVKLVEYIVK